jgi:putative cardiolipin synthase
MSATEMTRGSLRMMLVGAVAALAALISGCASLPPPEGRSASSAVTDTDRTRLGRAVTPGAIANTGKTGIY